MLSIPKYPEQYAQHFPTIFYLLCCASQHHVQPGPVLKYRFFCLSARDTVCPFRCDVEILMAPGGKPSCLTTLPAVRHCQSQCEPTDSQTHL